MMRWIAAAVLVAGSVAAVGESVPKTVDHVDLKRYAGKWYELARMPNRFEAKCDRDVTAEYTLDGDVVRVVNSCVKANGETTVSKGRAKVVDKTTGAKLKVTFFWPFYGNYWIIGLDPEYRWAVVGTPDRKYLWVLSRTPSLAPAEMESILTLVEERGYKRTDAVPTRQSDAR
ncbi:MAG: lipocalin family protein [Terriglobus sp.]